MSTDRGPWIATLSGARFYLDELNIEEIPLQDIAHALAMNCRYNGHIERHYSVAEHSVLVASVLAQQGHNHATVRAGLLHDVSEAFVPDIPRPFKKYITGFADFEEALLREASIAFDFPYPLPPAVEYIDRNIVANEAHSLFPNPPDWVDNYEYIQELEPEHFGLPADIARDMWLMIFNYYKDKDDVADY